MNEIDALIRKAEERPQASEELLEKGHYSESEAHGVVEYAREFLKFTKSYLEGLRNAD
ncbi:hypothetical protein [Thermococcus zilligii]|uniref:hypothetical protein n=1 Tax=Thermococcus zilligii TaxID=54076 RepID=UPI000AC231C0|nr:hypothetical protein [Thermococcus zilligii]